MSFDFIIIKKGIVEKLNVVKKDAKQFAALPQTARVV